MQDPIEFEEFERKANADPELHEFLVGVAQDASERALPEDSGRYVAVTPVEILVGIAAYALYRWLKDHLDHSRAENETKVAQQRERLIGSLIKDGFPPKEARDTVLILLDGIAKRTKDDPILSKARTILNQGERTGKG